MFDILYAIFLAYLINSTYMKKSTKLLAPALISALLTCGVLSAADIEWSGFEDSEWSNGANWQGDAVPGESDNAIIGGGSSADFNYSGGSQKINSLNVAGEQKSVLNINSGKLEVFNTTSPGTRVLKVGYDEGTSGEINIGGASASVYGVLELSSTLYTHAYLGYAGLGVINVTGYGKLNFLCDSSSNGYFTLGGGNTSETPNGTGILNLSGNSEAYFEVAKQGVVSLGGKAGSGYINMTDNAKLTAYNVEVGDNGAGHGEFHMSGSSHAIISTITSGWYGTGKIVVDENAQMDAGGLSVGFYGNGTLLVDGSARLTAENHVYVGYGAGITGDISVDGGTLAINKSAGRGDLLLGYNGNGILNVNGGSLIMEEVIRASRNASSSAVINLNGGVAQTRGVIAGGGSSELNFNGGTLKAAANAYNADGSRFVNAVQINLLEHGGTIDTNGQNLAIAALVTGAGSLRKDGSGILAFMQANSMTGDLVVDSGGILAAHADAFGLANVVVNSGATADTSVALANVGGIDLSGGVLNANGADVGSYSVSGGNFVMNSGALQLTISDPDNFDTFFGDGGNEFLIYAGVLELVIADIDYDRTYAVFKNFASGTVMDELKIIGYDTEHYTAVLGEDGVLSFVNVPEPAEIAALLGMLALALCIWRRKK